MQLTKSKINRVCIYIYMTPSPLVAVKIVGSKQPFIITRKVFLGLYYVFEERITDNLISNYLWECFKKNCPLKYQVMAQELLILAA